MSTREWVIDPDTGDPVLVVDGRERARIPNPDQIEMDRARSVGSIIGLDDIKEVLERAAGRAGDAASLHPFTSLDRLRTCPRPDDRPGGTVVVACVRPDGQFEFHLEGVGRRGRGTRVVPLAAARDVTLARLLRLDLET